MNIDESNAIVRETILNNMTNNRCLKILDEFGYYQYLIYFDMEKSQVLFGFKSEDFGRIFEYSGKDCLASDFAGFDYELNVEFLGTKLSLLMRIDVAKYSRCFESNNFINIEIKKDLPAEEKEAIMLENEKLRKELDVYANATSNLFARFRVIYYTSVIKKMFSELKEKKVPSSMVLNLNSTNLMYVVPSGDKVVLYFGIDFNQKTDISLARVFLQELEDSKRHVRGAVDTKFYADTSKPPGELNGLEANPKRFSCGFLSFSKYILN